MTMNLATVTLEGIEVAHIIRKRQFDAASQSAFRQFVTLAGACHDVLVER